MGTENKTRWTRVRPTQPGAYWVRGFELGNPLKQALVEVRKRRGRLLCNLHECTSDTSPEEVDEWPEMIDMSQNFQWRGPLLEPTNDR